MSLTANHRNPFRSMMKHCSIVVGATMLLLTRGAAAQLGIDCGSLDNAYGPYDYSNASHRRERLGIVEWAHFGPSVQNLKLQPQGNPLVGDLDYTLRAFPNHHKALYAAIRYEFSDNPDHRQPMPYTVDCYMQRAVTWRPDDGNVRLLYGIYKSRIDDLDGAKLMFAEAERLMPDSAEVHYNVGLVLAKAGEYEEALRHAHTAYALGHPMPGLRNILQRAGQWKDPATQSPESES